MTEYRSDAISQMLALRAAYAHYHAAACGTFGPVRDAWDAKACRARNAVRLAIFAIREGDYAEEWAA